MKLISKGAEASIYLDGDIIIKTREKKGYRLKQLDNSLRKQRTRSESKIMQRLEKVIRCPKYLSSDDIDMTIRMEYISAPRVRDVLDDNIDIIKKIAKGLALMHNLGIVHGDPTTSNMLFHEKQVYFIDFGLSYFSDRIEDKAVDLHILCQALSSRHHTIYEKSINILLKNYMVHSQESDRIIDRFDQVVARGRNKSK